MKKTKEEKTEELLEEYRELVKTKAHLYYVLGGDMEDIIQEGMIGLYKAIQSFDESRGASFRTFADLCITRQIISAIKSSSRKKHNPLNSALSFDRPLEPSAGYDKGELTLAETLAAGADSDPERIALLREMTELILAPDARILSKSEHEVLKLLLESKDYIEIAALLGKTPKQIDNAIQRIRKKLKKLILI